MLVERDDLPAGSLERNAPALHECLAGPTLIHLPGRRTPPLFVSVLLHGDEDTGWEAVRRVLRSHAGRELPRALSLFIGNVQAARYGHRFLASQPDYNRIWGGASHLPEGAMTRAVVDSMRRRGVFASLDVHNNTGINPHYACVRRLEAPFLHLATLFGRTVVYFTKPDGVQVEAFSALCPAVTLECGQAGQAHGVEHVADYIEACLNLAEIPQHPVAPHDIDLYHTVATVKVPPAVSFGFDSDATDLRLADDLEQLNFRELPIDTLLARVRPGSNAGLLVLNEHGEDCTARYLRAAGDEIRTCAPVMPAMFTHNARAIRQDCLGYFMERPITPEAARTQMHGERR